MILRRTLRLKKTRLNGNGDRLKHHCFFLALFLKIEYIKRGNYREGKRMKITKTASLTIMIVLCLAGCNFTENKVQLTKQEKNYVKELQKDQNVLNCQPTLDEVSTIVESLCRKAGMQNIGIEVVY